MRGCGGLNRSLALCLLFCSAFCLQSATTTFIFFGSSWRYNDFGEPGPNWFTAAYPDGDWKFNFGEFGYGDGDEQTLTLPATTTYFRMFLTITNPHDYAAFELHIRRDDGVAVYLNGTEV